MDAFSAAERALLARRFVDEPYWKVMCRMLTGTIQSEHEEMLTNDARLPLSRASVAICRKVMRMPFLDIEQGEKAAKVLERLERFRPGRGDNAQSVS